MSNTRKLFESFQNNLNEEVKETKTFKERFNEWLDDNVKSQDYNLNAYIDDLTTQWGETGRTQYELSKFKSKSGNPELFDYDEEDLKELGYNLDEGVDNTTEDIEWEQTPIAEYNGNSLYKSVGTMNIEGVDYVSYLERDKEGNGVRSFILPVTGTEDLKATKKLKESMNEEVKEYRYITNHGIGPGATPEGVYIRSEELPNGKTAIYLNRPLTDEELKKYDIKPEWIQENTLNEVGEGHTYDFVYGGDYDKFKVDGKTVYNTRYVKRNVPVYSDDKEELRKHAENIFSEMIENAKAEDLVMIERDRAINTIYDYLLQYNYYDENLKENVNEETEITGKVKPIEMSEYINAYKDKYGKEPKTAEWKAEVIGTDLVKIDGKLYRFNRDTKQLEENVNEEDKGMKLKEDYEEDDYKDLPEFHSAFQITRNIIFFVNYYRLGNNEHQYFSTSADELMRNKRDISTGGQAQERLLPEGSVARKFYEKWDYKHLHYMTEEEYNEMRADLEILKNTYNYIEQERDISFSQEVELSKEPLKKIRESAKPLTTKGLMESLHNLKEDYEDDDYEDEEDDIYTKAENWDGNMATDDLEDYEWREILDNAPEVYKQALRARENYVKDSWGEIPDLVWQVMESFIDDGSFGNPDNVSPAYIIDNVIINGDYGDFDNYKQDGETDEEFISRVEDEVLEIFPEERFVIFSL